MYEHFLSLIQSYGYIAVFIGSVFEGESIMLVSGVLAHEGYLSFSKMIGVAFLGAVVGDWGWFYLGRGYGVSLLNRFAFIKKMMSKPTDIIHKNPIKLSFFMRFMYGFRHVIPFSLGMSKLPARIFFFWNALGAGLWAVVFGSAGYLLINIIETVLGNIRKYQIILIVGVILALGLINFILYLVKKYLYKHI